MKVVAPRAAQIVSSRLVVPSFMVYSIEIRSYLTDRLWRATGTGIQSLLKSQVKGRRAKTDCHAVQIYFVLDLIRTHLKSIPLNGLTAFFIMVDVRRLPIKP